MADKKESLLRIINASGFLFQLRLVEEVKRTHSTHGWDVLAQEHPWKNREMATDGFIDLVLGQGIVRIVVECKRSLDANWVFLVPQNVGRAERRARCLWTHRAKDKSDLMGWDDFLVNPGSPQATFCVVRGQGEKDKPMLEKMTDVLLDSLESLAFEELQLGTRHETGETRIYIPAIITTAKLEVCRFDSGDIDINTGRLSSAKSTFESVPFVRFRKGLSTSLSDRKSTRDLKEANKEKERTVFIICAEKLPGILKDWKTESQFGDSLPWKIEAAREIRP